MTDRRERASGAALAGALLAAMPLLDVVLGGGGGVAVRVVVGGCGIALLALAAGSWAGRGRA